MVRPSWMDSDALALYDAHEGLTLSSSDVTAWADLSPTNADLAPTGATPATYSATGIGTGPAVLCGTGLVSSSVALTSAAALTVIAVQRAGADLRNTVGFLVNTYYGFTLFRDGLWRWCGDGDGGGAAAYGTPSTADEYVVATLGTAATRIYRRDGASALDSSSNGATNYSGTGTIDVATTARGRSGVAALGLLCLVPRELTAGELAAAEAYCAAGWGL